MPSKNKYLHLSSEIIDKSCQIKNGIVWAYLCSKEVPCELEEIASHYKMSKNKTKIALQEMAKIGAVFLKEIDGKVHYQANPETYFLSN